MRKPTRRHHHPIEAMERRLLLSTTIYVDANARGPGQDVTPWASAFTDLQDALAIAAPGDVILVADGTYKPTSTTDWTRSFQLINGVTILGGFAGDGAPDPDVRDVNTYKTILSGDIGVVGSDKDNCYHVVSGSFTDATAVLDGFTITAGAATYAGGFPYSFGGGMFNSGGSPTVRNCIFTGNKATNGGGVFNGSSSATFTDCAFENNFASDDGGGMYIMPVNGKPTILRCAFRNNTADGDGGGLYSTQTLLTLRDSTFADNRSYSRGGAIAGNQMTISFCAFTRNRSYSSGGAVYGDFLTVSDSSFSNNLSQNYLGGGISATRSEVDRCTFTGNSAYSGGGAELDAWTSFVNCRFLSNVAQYSGGGVIITGGPGDIISSVFVGNSASVSGGALAFAKSGGTHTVAGCTFAENLAGVSGGAVTSSLSWPTCINDIFWNDLAPIDSELNDPNSRVNVLHSDVRGGWSGAGSANIDVNPQFMREPQPGTDRSWGTSDDDHGDLRLRIGSPCLDVGDNTAITGASPKDVLGNPRIIDVLETGNTGPTTDLGAYERIIPFGDGDFLHDAPKPSLSVRIGFRALPASISASDLTLFNLTTGESIHLAANSIVNYDASTRTAVWSLNCLLRDGNYRAILLKDSVTDAGGAPALGADLSFDFFALGGDANRDRMVDIDDLSILTRNWNGSGKVFSQGDFNYDGKVDAKDLGILSSHWQQTLPPPVPTAPVRAPTRAPARVAALVL